MDNKDTENIKKYEVFNDLNESPFIYYYGNIKFYFSSRFYLEKFISDHVKFLKDESLKLNIKFKSNIDASLMILLLLYRKIEKRGFKITIKDKIDGTEIDINQNYSFDVVLKA